MAKGDEVVLTTSMTNMELARIVKEQLADNKKLKEALEQEKENDEKDKEMRIMMERILALEKKEKSIRQDEEVLVKDEGE